MDNGQPITESYIRRKKSSIISRRISDDNGDIVYVRLNRTATFNAIDTTLLVQFRETLKKYHEQASTLVLEGVNGTFSIGCDIHELQTFDGERAKAYCLLCHEIVAMIEQWPGATIASIEGLAIGAGLELALTCDFIVGNAECRLGMPGLAWALLPVMGGFHRLIARAGMATAHRLFLGGTILEYKEAHDVGILNHINPIVPTQADDNGLAQSLPEDALEAALALAQDYPESAVRAIRDIRLAQTRMLNAEQEADLFAFGFYSGECQQRLNELLQ